MFVLYICSAQLALALSMHCLVILQSHLSAFACPLPSWCQNQPGIQRKTWCVGSPTLIQNPLWWAIPLPEANMFTCNNLSLSLWHSLLPLSNNDVLSLPLFSVAGEVHALADQSSDNATNLTGIMQQPEAGLAATSKSVVAMPPISHSPSLAMPVAPAPSSSPPIEDTAAHGNKARRSPRKASAQAVPMTGEFAHDTLLQTGLRHLATVSLIPLSWCIGGTYIYIWCGGHGNLSCGGDCWKVCKHTNRHFLAWLSLRT
jgi:hypothetical protein